MMTIAMTGLNGRPVHVQMTTRLTEVVVVLASHESASCKPEGTVTMTALRSYLTQEFLLKPNQQTMNAGDDV